MDTWFGFEINTEESVALQLLRVLGMEEAVEGAEFVAGMLPTLVYSSREQGGRGVSRFGVMTGFRAGA